MDRFNQRENQNSKPWNNSSYYQGWTPSRDMTEAQRSKCLDQYNKGLALASMCTTQYNFKTEPPYHQSSSFTASPIGGPSQESPQYSTRGSLRPPPLPPTLPSFSSNNENVSYGPGKIDKPSSPMKPPSENRSALPTFRYMRFKKEIQIRSNDSRMPLTYQQMKTLMAEILERILTAEGEEMKPRFFGTKNYDGCLIVICGDNTSVFWLKKLIKELSPNYPGGLHVEENFSDDNQYTLVANFQDSLNDSNERILTFLKNQNEGLDVSRWKVIGRASKKNVVQLTFLIDFDSAEILKRRGERLSYKFGVTRMVLENQFCGKNIDDNLLNKINLSLSVPSMDQFPETSTRLPFSDLKSDLTPGPEALANTTRFVGSKRKPKPLRNKFKKLRRKKNDKLN